MNLNNKILLTITVVFFHLSAVYCQDTATATQPFLTYSAAHQRQQLLIRRLSDYSYLVGQDFGKFSVTNQDGDVILNNDSLMGRVVFVNFWFDGCAYCHNLFEPLNKLAKYYKNNPRFKLISFTFDNIATIKRNIERYQLLYPVHHLSEVECHSLITDKGFPVNFLLTPEGKIIDGFGVTPLLGNASFFEDDVMPKIDSLLSAMQVHQ